MRFYYLLFTFYFSNLKIACHFFFFAFSFLLFHVYWVYFGGEILFCKSEKPWTILYYFIPISLSSFLGLKLHICYTTSDCSRVTKIYYENYVCHCTLYFGLSNLYYTVFITNMVFFCRVQDFDKAVQWVLFLDIIFSIVGVPLGAFWVCIFLLCFTMWSLKQSV